MTTPSMLTLSRGSRPIFRSRVIAAPQRFAHAKPPSTPVTSMCPAARAQGTRAISGPASVMIPSGTPIPAWPSSQPAAIVSPRGAGAAWRPALRKTTSASCQTSPLPALVFRHQNSVEPALGDRVPQTLREFTRLSGPECFLVEMCCKQPVAGLLDHGAFFVHRPTLLHLTPTLSSREERVVSAANRVGWALDKTIIASPTPGR